MQIRFIDKTIFQICGYSIETSLEESEQDVAALYSDYFNTEKSALVDNVAKNKAAEYYGLMWYLEGHERYRYLLGKEAANPSLIPSEAELKEIPAALYAVASFEKDYNGVKAWTDFFFEAIPQALRFEAIPQAHIPQALRLTKVVTYAMFLSIRVTKMHIKVK